MVQVPSLNTRMAAMQHESQPCELLSQPLQASYPQLQPGGTLPDRQQQMQGEPVAVESERSPASTVVGGASQLAKAAARRHAARQAAADTR